MNVENKSFLVELEDGVELSGLLDRPEDAKSAPVVVYLHGFGSSQGGEKADFFRRRLRAAGLGFCSFDFRGHGDSGGGMEGLSLGRSLADVAAVVSYLESRGIRDLTLLGSSMGGLVGLWFAARHPSQVVAQCHIAPAIGLAEGFESLLGDRGVERWRREGLLEITNELGTFEVGWGFAESLKQHPTAELAALHLRVGPPALLLQGKLDDRVDWRLVRDFADTTQAASRLVLFEDGDHRLLEYRDRIWLEMEAFLASLAHNGPATLSAQKRTKIG